jgi:penicillin-binding protein 2
MTEHSRVRVSIVGVIVVALFSALLTRLWFLQVSDPDAAQRVTSSIDRRSEREVYYEAPRGWIYDRDGRVIVQNRVTWVIRIDRRLTGDQKDQAIAHLSELLGLTPEQIDARLEDVRVSPQEDAVVAIDIPDSIRTEIAEHREHYPYIQVEQQAVREYPLGDEKVLAAVLGYVGSVSKEDLERHPTGYGRLDTIGRGGIEAAMEAELRGQRAYEKLSVNPAGQVIGDPIASRPGVKGNDVYLTIDLPLQRSVERSLAEGILVARQTPNTDIEIEGYQPMFRATAGAAIVMDVTNGEILSMASLPSFDPSELAGGVSESRWLELQQQEGDPLFNRATKAGVPPGSTFKLITAIAGTTAGVRSPGELVADQNCYRNQAGERSQEFCNAGRELANGGDMMDMARAMAVSSDTYYYEIGDLLWDIWDTGDPRTGDAIQNTARQFGFGDDTGIEIGESENRVPDAEWRRAYTHQQADKGVEPYASNVNDWDDWNPADNINLAVGQGDLIVSPLQLVGAYAAFANGGTLWVPHLVAEVRSADGERASGVEAVARRQILIPATARIALEQGLYGAVTDGTARRAFSGFDLEAVPVMGKTGTAQRSKYPGCARPEPQGSAPNGPEDITGCLGDTSWFVGVSSVGGTPKYAVVVMVEEGGFGGDIAAPIARQIFEALHRMPVTPIPDVPVDDANR